MSWPGKSVEYPFWWTPWKNICEAHLHIKHSRCLSWNLVHDTPTFIDATLQWRHNDRRDSNTENVSIWWHNVYKYICINDFIYQSLSEKTLTLWCFCRFSAGRMVLGVWGAWVIVHVHWWPNGETRQSDIYAIYMSLQRHFYCIYCIRFRPFWTFFLSKRSLLLWRLHWSDIYAMYVMYVTPMSDIYDICGDMYERYIVLTLYMCYIYTYIYIYIYHIRFCWY